eukprot:924685_1
MSTSCNSLYQCPISLFLLMNSATVSFLVASRQPCFLYFRCKSVKLQYIMSANICDTDIGKSAGISNDLFVSPSALAFKLFPFAHLFPHLFVVVFSLAFHYNPFDEWKYITAFPKTSCNFWGSMV